MVQLTRIYTKSGDKGKTSLGNGKRVQKSSIRIDAIGTVDELNCSLGLVLLHLEKSDIYDLILKIQNDLFDVGADLCLPEEKYDFDPLRITPQYTDYLEQMIDHYNASLNPLASFILPGGSAASSYIHLSRAIARRAERLVCALKEIEDLSQPLVIYLNRLSDLLFVLGRYLNDKGTNDILWIPGGVK